VITGTVRSGRAAVVPFAVGGYIAAAYWFTSSTSFANPAITIGRTLTDTFSGIAPRSAPAFIAAQLIGAALAVAFASYVFHEPAGQQLVVEHEVPAP
jgi:glycerol uptake facilitator-like aquaporin